MAYRKQLSEILEEFNPKDTVAERAATLKSNWNIQLRKFLELYVFHKGSFIFDEPITYKPSDLPQGMGWTDTLREIDKMYLFLKDHPKSPKTLTMDKKKNLAIMTLESMDAPEAEVFHRLITNKLTIKGLTNKVLEQVDPTLIDKEPADSNELDLK